MRKDPDKKVILEDGQEYLGWSFGADKEAILEIVFNTSMVGYQEILSDPSYTDQAVVMTYPLIGNYGMAEDDYETDTPSIGALIVHEYNDEPSNFRSASSLGQVMAKYGIVGVSGVDTRKLNRSIRDFGSRRAIITSADTTLEDGLARLSTCIMPKDAVSRVSCRAKRLFPATEERFHVVAARRRSAAQGGQIIAKGAEPYGSALCMNKHPPAKRVVLLMRAKPYVLRARVKRVSTVCQLRRIVTCRP